MAYYVSKDTNVLLKKISESGSNKKYVTRNDLTFTEEELQNQSRGWYKFERSGWRMMVKETNVLDENIWDIF